MAQQLPQFWRITTSKNATFLPFFAPKEKEKKLIKNLYNCVSQYKIKPYIQILYLKTTFVDNLRNVKKVKI
jgi:hypothetical protein